jgi:vacuolar-type H+-ATPase subunit I/STV1
MADEQQMMFLNPPNFNPIVETKFEIPFTIIVSYLVLGISIYMTAYLLLDYLIKVTNRVKELEKRLSFLEKNTDSNFKIIMENDESITDYIEEIQEQVNMNINSITKNQELMTELINKNKSKIVTLETRIEYDNENNKSKLETVISDIVNINNLVEEIASLGGIAPCLKRNKFIDDDKCNQFIIEFKRNNMIMGV